MAFLDEIAGRLVSQGVGTLAHDIFLGKKARIPSDVTDTGPYLTLIETGGSGPTRIQNQSSVATQRPTAQVGCRARSYKTARDKLKQAYDALDGLFNVTLSGTFYVSVTARQEPTDIGLDDAGRAFVAFNIDAEKYPS